ncbi:carboxylesterase family protein [Nocardia sp. NPDC049737]|uniref:carboxylesterase family protein n=1 Tax=Nocardia sp. NPDC049737 TaxID=3154358 RepID=UPI0034418E3B
MEPIASIVCGKVRRPSRDGLTEFPGIPYAAAPVGSARFQLPQPGPRWSGIRDALTRGPACVQAPYPPPVHALIGGDRIPGDECLNLNVFDAGAGEAALPVLAKRTARSSPRGGLGRAGVGVAARLTQVCQGLAAESDPPPEPRPLKAHKAMGR